MCECPKECIHCTIRRGASDVSLDLDQGVHAEGSLLEPLTTPPDRPDIGWFSHVLLSIFFRFCHWRRREISLHSDELGLPILVTVPTVRDVLRPLGGAIMTHLHAALNIELEFHRFLKQISNWLSNLTVLLTM